MFLYVLSTITFQTFSGSFSRHRSLKETSIWLTDLQISVSVQTGTFQKIANNIYIVEMPILGLMIPKKNAAVCNGITIVLYEMEGCNMAPKFKGFLPPFSKMGRIWNDVGFSISYGAWVLPFHTGTAKGDILTWEDCTTNKNCDFNFNQEKVRVWQAKTTTHTNLSNKIRCPEPNNAPGM